MHPRTTTTHATLICLALTNTIACSTAQAQTWDVTRIFGQNRRASDQLQPGRAEPIVSSVRCVDRSVAAPAPSRVYIWDSGNNRILGFDHAGRCEAGPPQLQGTACTENSMCGAGGHCSGDLNAHSDDRDWPAFRDTTRAPARRQYQEGSSARRFAVRNSVSLSDQVHSKVRAPIRWRRMLLTICMSSICRTTAPLRYTDPFTTIPLPTRSGDKATSQRAIAIGRTRTGCDHAVHRPLAGTYFLVSGAVDVTPTADDRVADYGNHRCCASIRVIRPQIWFSDSAPC